MYMSNFVHKSSISSMLDDNKSKDKNSTRLNNSQNFRNNFKLKNLFTPKTILGGFVLALLLVGGVSAMVLTQMNQDVRQQASTGDYNTGAGTGGSDTSQVGKDGVNWDNQSEETKKAFSIYEDPKAQWEYERQHYLETGAWGGSSDPEVLKNFWDWKNSPLGEAGATAVGGSQSVTGVPEGFVNKNITTHIYIEGFGWVLPNKAMEFYGTEKGATCGVDEKGSLCCPASACSGETVSINQWSTLQPTGSGRGYNCRSGDWECARREMADQVARQTAQPSATVNVTMYDDKTGSVITYNSTSQLVAAIPNSARTVEEKQDAYDSFERDRFIRIAQETANKNINNVLERLNSGGITYATAKKTFEANCGDKITLGNETDCNSLDKAIVVAKQAEFDAQEVAKFQNIIKQTARDNISTAIGKLDDGDISYYNVANKTYENSCGSNQSASNEDVCDSLEKSLSNQREKFANLDDDYFGVGGTDDNTPPTNYVVDDTAVTSVIEDKKVPSEERDGSRSCSSGYKLSANGRECIRDDNYFGVGGADDQTSFESGYVVDDTEVTPIGEYFFSANDHDSVVNATENFDPDDLLTAQEKYNRGCTGDGEAGSDVCNPLLDKIKKAQEIKLIGKTQDNRLAELTIAQLKKDGNVETAEMRQGLFCKEGSEKATKEMCDSLSDAIDVQKANRGLKNIVSNISNWWTNIVSSNKSLVAEIEDKERLLAGIEGNLSIYDEGVKIQIEAVKSGDLEPGIARELHKELCLKGSGVTKGVCEEFDNVIIDAETSLGVAIDNIDNLTNKEIDSVLSNCGIDIPCEEMEGTRECKAGYKLVKGGTQCEKIKNLGEIIGDFTSNVSDFVESVVTFGRETAGKVSDKQLNDAIALVDPINEDLFGKIEGEDLNNMQKAGTAYNQVCLGKNPLGSDSLCKPLKVKLRSLTARHLEALKAIREAEELKATEIANPEQIYPETPLVEDVLSDALPVSVIATMDESEVKICYVEHNGRCTSKTVPIDASCASSCMSFSSSLINKDQGALALNPSISCGKKTNSGCAEVKTTAGSCSEAGLDDSCGSSEETKEAPLPLPDSPLLPVPADETEVPVVEDENKSNLHSDAANDFMVGVIDNNQVDLDSLLETEKNKNFLEKAISGVTGWVNNVFNTPETIKKEILINNRNIELATRMLEQDDLNLSEATQVYEFRCNGSSSKSCTDFSESISDKKKTIPTEERDGSRNCSSGYKLSTNGRECVKVNPLDALAVEKDEDTTLLEDQDNSNEKKGLGGIISNVAFSISNWWGKLTNDSDLEEVEERIASWEINNGIDGLDSGNVSLGEATDIYINQCGDKVSEGNQEPCRVLNQSIQNKKDTGEKEKLQNIGNQLITENVSAAIIKLGEKSAGYTDITDEKNIYESYCKGELSLENQRACNSLSQSINTQNLENSVRWNNTDIYVSIDRFKKRELSITQLKETRERLCNGNQQTSVSACNSIKSYIDNYLKVDDNLDSDQVGIVIDEEDNRAIVAEDAPKGWLGQTVDNVFGWMGNLFRNNSKQEEPVSEEIGLDPRLRDIEDEKITKDVTEITMEDEVAIIKGCNPGYKLSDSGVGCVKIKGLGDRISDVVVGVNNLWSSVFNTTNKAVLETNLAIDGLKSGDMDYVEANQYYGNNCGDDSLVDESTCSELNRFLYYEYEKNKFKNIVKTTASDNINRVISQKNYEIAGKTFDYYCKEGSLFEDKPECNSLGELSDIKDACGWHIGNFSCPQECINDSVFIVGSCGGIGTKKKLEVAVTPVYKTVLEKGVDDGVLRYEEDYGPKGLVNIKDKGIVTLGDEVQVVDKALPALQGFIEEAKKMGYTVGVAYGYRSYELQDLLHQNNPNGAAIAGTSQHQSGLAVDLYVLDSGSTDWSTMRGIPAELIPIAESYGLVRPLEWDTAHFVVLDAISPDIIDDLKVAGFEPSPDDPFDYSTNYIINEILNLI